MPDAPFPRLTEEQMEKLILSIVRQQPGGLHENDIMRHVDRVQEEWRKHKTMVALFELVFVGSIDIDASPENPDDWKFFDVNKAGGQ